ADLRIRSVPKLCRCILAMAYRLGCRIWARRQRAELTGPLFRWNAARSRVAGRSGWGNPAYVIAAPAKNLGCRAAPQPPMLLTIANEVIEFGVRRVPPIVPCGRISYAAELPCGLSPTTQHFVTMPTRCAPRSSRVRYRTWRIVLINMAPAVPGAIGLKRRTLAAGLPTDPPLIPASAAKGRTSMRALLRLSLAITALAALAPAVLSQQAFPTHPIRLIVPYPAGGATDVVARIVAEKMSEELGQQIYVDNRPGAGTMIGASAVARSAPDGYMMLIGDTGTLQFRDYPDLPKIVRHRSAIALMYRATEARRPEADAQQA